MGLRQSDELTGIIEGEDGSKGRTRALTECMMDWGLPKGRSRRKYKVPGVCISDLGY